MACLDLGIGVFVFRSFVFVLWCGLRASTKVPRMSHYCYILFLDPSVTTSEHCCKT